MRRSALRPLTRRPRFGTRSPVVAGIAQGLFVAAGFSALAALRLVSVPRGAAGVQALRAYGVAVAFYAAAGIVGGAVYGLLRPLHDRYWGRLLTAYLILYLVYGGGTVALLPLLDPDPPPLRALLLLWAAICVVLAPIYVAMSGRGASTPGSAPPAT